jgi:hypothetical protein
MKIADVFGGVVFVAASTVFAQGPPPSALVEVGEEATQIFDGGGARGNGMFMRSRRRSVVVLIAIFKLLI